MNLFETHDRDRRAEGARGFWTSLTLLFSTILVGVGLATTPVVSASPQPLRSDQRTVDRLQRKVDEQANDLRQLRTLFRICLDVGCDHVDDTTVPQMVSRPTGSGRSTEVVKVQTRTETRGSETPSTVRTQNTPAPEPEPSTNVQDVVKDTTDTVEQTVGDVLGTVKKVTSK